METLLEIAEAGDFADDHCYVTMHRSTHARQFACLVCSLIDKMGRNLKKNLSKVQKIVVFDNFLLFFGLRHAKSYTILFILNISKTKNI